MSIGSIGSSSWTPHFALRVRSFANDNASDPPVAQPSATACAAGGTCLAPGTQLPAAQSPGGLAGFRGLTGFSGQTVQESHLALQIRSRSEVRTDRDGTVAERTSTQLKFHYDLTTADGQHIELNVKAKVQQSSVQDAAGNSISKTQVKLQFSLLQEGVAEDLSPLLSDQVPSDTRSGVSDGLQAFLNSIGDAIQEFTAGENATADDLLTKTVDTFNTLVDALKTLLFPAAENDAPPALPTSDEAPVLIPPVSLPPLGNSEPVPAVPVDEPAQPETPLETSENTAVARDPQNSADEVPVDSTFTDQNAPTIQPALAEGDVAPPAEPDAAASPTQLATQVLQSVRLRFVQSLTQIIRSLTPDEQSGNGSSASQFLYSRSALSLKIHSESLVDVNA